MSEFIISTDKSLIDIGVVHSFLSEQAYWSKGIPLETVKTSIENSLCFGVYSGDRQVGFARVITDYATIAYIGDVFILDGYRNLGLSRRLMDEIVRHPSLQGLRRWILLTSDAHGLYSKYGFKQVARPELWMELHDPNVYKK